MLKSRTMVALATLPAVFAAARAEVPELTELVPEAKGYELIERFDPRTPLTGQFRGDELSGELRRVGYLLKLTEKDGSIRWAFAAMDPFAARIDAIGLPAAGAEGVQNYVTNLEVAGNVPGLKTGKFDKGFLEFWGTDYGPGNVKNVPGANGAKFDFGDERRANGAYGSMQVHNFAGQQTVMAFNSHRSGTNCDLGIGNNPDSAGNPDWTFARNGGRFAAAEMLVVAKIDNLKIHPVTRLNPARLEFEMKSDKMEFAPGEPMVFSFRFNLNGAAKPSAPYFLEWTRSGDDGKTERGREEIVWNEPMTVRTALDKPGFVRIFARLVDGRGNPVMRMNGNRAIPLAFDGGAGVKIAEIRQATPEPEDFDAFWKKQRELLTAVPLKPEMTELKSANPKVKIFAVSVPCAGPRPMTAYLTVPADDSRKYPATAYYQGYGFNRPGAPNNGPADRIALHVNAHGYDLGKSDAYYNEFAQAIRSNHIQYAWDPVQNASPETAYFRGMALRVMRSLDFLKSLPQWDGKELRVAGGSQGGLQTVWAAALDPAVTHAAPVIPWCCDLNGKTAGRLGGWFPAWTPALGYFDAVNHGKRIRCFTDIERAGLGDYTCPPSGVAALYNGMTCPKRITWFQDSTHGYIAPKSQRFTVEKR